MSRIATATLKWIVDDSEIAASWAKIKAQTAEPVAVKLGLPGAGGSAIGTPTLGGTFAGSGTLPAGLTAGGGAMSLQPALAQLGQQIAQSVGQAVRAAQFGGGPDFGGMAADRWIENAEQIESGGRALSLGSRSFADTPTGRQASRRGMGWRVFGAGLFAAHGVMSIYSAEEEDEQIDEMWGRNDQAGALQSQLSRIRRQRQGGSGLVRRVASSTTAQSVLGSIMGAVYAPLGKAYSGVGGAVAQSYDDAGGEEDILKAQALGQFNAGSESILYQNRRLQRQAGSFNLDPVARTRMEGEQAMDDARHAMVPMSTLAGVLRSFGLTSASQQLQRLVNSHVSGTEALSAARNADAERERDEAGSDLISADDAASARAGNRPLLAARLSLSGRHTRALRDLVRTHSILTPFARMLFAHEDEALRTDQGRDVAAEGVSLDARNDAGIALIGRNPLAARLREIEGRGVSELLRTPRDAEYNANRARIARGVGIDSALARQEDQDRQEAIGLHLSTESIQIQRLLNRNPTGAEAAGIVGGTIAQATALRNQGMGGLALQALGVGGQRLDLLQQNYLRSFKPADEDARFFNYSGVETGEDPSTVLGQIAQGKRQLLGAGIGGAAKKIGQFLSNVDPSGLFGAATGQGGGGGDAEKIVEKLEDQTKRIEAGLKALVSE